VIGVLVDVSDRSAAESEQTKTIKEGEKASVWFLTTHIATDSPVVETIELFKDVVSTLSSNYPSVPIIVTGDFNATPQQPSIEFITSAMTDLWPNCSLPNGGPGFTFNSSIPTERIDYQLLERKSQSLISCHNISVPNTQASDHRPVLSSLSFVST